MMYKVEGYEFETKEQADMARNEIDTIRYIRSNSRMDDPDVLLASYNKLVLKAIFVTPVGFDFPHRLQEYLYTIPYIKREDVLPIPVYRPEPVKAKDKREEKEIVKRAEKRQEEKRKVVEKHRKKDEKDYRKLFHISTFAAVVFGIVVIFMFVITGISKDNVTIMNYENEIIDKYEKWEQELTEREQALKEREEALTEQEGQE